MAAGKHGVDEGAIVTANTSNARVAMGDIFALSADWSTVRELSNDALKNTINYQPATPASAILVNYVRSGQVPCYIASLGFAPLHPGHYTLAPTGDFMVFFSDQSEGTAFNRNVVPFSSFVFHYQNQPNADIDFMESGEWVKRNPSSVVAPKASL